MIQIWFCNANNYHSFLKWNIPYTNMRQSPLRAFSHTSPLAFSVPTPGSDVAVATPPPRDAPSPTTMVLKEKVRVDRARLFAAGHHEELLMSMDDQERM